MKILLVEDDEAIAQMLSDVLAEQHHTLDVASDGQRGWELAETFTYDLIVLDVVLPNLDGISLCRRLRSHRLTMPILLLTSRNSSDDKVMGFDAGADDYVVKPFDAQELVARIRALLRRGPAPLPPVLEWGALHLDPSTCEVTYGEHLLHLTPKEYSLLELFMRNSSRVFSRSAILEQLWSFEEPPAEETVRAHIKGLRQKLKTAGAPADLIETVYGLGYRLKPQTAFFTGKSEAFGFAAVPPAEKEPAAGVAAERQRDAAKDEFKKSNAAPVLAATPAPPIADGLQQPFRDAAESLREAENTERENFNASIGRLWERFKEPIVKRMDTVEVAIAALFTGTLNSELKARAISEVHKLAGSLGTFGFALGSEIARKIEHLFQAEFLTPEQAPHLQELIQQMRASVQPRETAAASSEEAAEREDVGTAAIARGKNPRELPELEAANFCRDASRSVPTVGAPHFCASPSPIAETSPLPFAPSRRSFAPEHTQPSVLLIADSDPELARQLVAQGTAAGLNVETTLTSAASGAIERHPADAVLLDLSCPETAEEGMLLLSHLTRRVPPVPVLVLTDKDGFADRLEVARRGGRAFLQKPVPPAVAIDVVLDVLQRFKTHQAKVLVVDDDPQVLAVVQTLLKPWGFKVTTLEDPSQFWETLETCVPDILVLDIQMPDLSGIELCQVVRNDPRWSGLPVLFLTAYTDADTVHQVFACGADDYASKPVVGPELVTRLLNRLERTQLLRSWAETDALTGVANRRKSLQDLGQLLRLADRYSQPLCFALLDLDRFKQVNDLYGHAAGDSVLRRFGELLMRTFRSEDVVARWGGEEFVVGMYGMSRDNGIKRLLEFLEHWREQLFSGAGGQPFHVSFSAGVVEYPQDGSEVQTLYRNADAALSRAKLEGRDRVVSLLLP